MKSLRYFLVVLLLGFGLIACEGEEPIEDAVQGVEDTVEDAGEAVEDVGEGE